MRKIDALLVGAAFLMVLFLNTYFNLTSDVALNKDATSLEDKFYLAGPDPYYNMRLVKTTVETGKYPFMGGVHGGLDPLLNYPIGGTGGRPPLFNMMAVGFGSFLSIFMGETDGLGYAMQFLPALYGALLVIPVYFIASMLFNRKAGIMAAWIIPLLPIHLASGHGSSYALYDHDSFILLLSSFVLMFLMMSLKEENKKKSTLYAALSGIFIAAITMTWVSSQYIYAVVAVFAILQMIVDIVAKKINTDIIRSVLVAMFLGYFLSFPILWVKFGFTPTVQLIIPIGVTVFGGIYLYLGKKNIPWLLSIPTLFAIAGVVLSFLYVIRTSTASWLKPFISISNIIFGSGIYGTKVSLTIAEASTFDISRTIMSFGPATYLLAWMGFFLLLYRYYKKGFKSYNMVVIAWFGIETWLLSVAGRFLNDLVPLIAILSAPVLWIFVDKIDFKAMAKTLKGVGGGWYGIKKAVKIRHVAGPLLIALFVIFPNGWLAVDASIPSNMKSKFHTDKVGAFGLSVGTERYWQDAFQWLRSQTGKMNESDKPGFMSWWDYGFYCVAISNNPTVADNFQEGIPAAANFHTSESETEAITVMITRLVEGDMARNDGKVSPEVRNVFKNYLGNRSVDIVQIMEDPANYTNTTYNTIIGAEYGGEKYRVREDDARYHDASTLLMKYLNEDKIVTLYRELQNVTGNSIRYYGVEGYDVNIFNVFTFLADKGSYGYDTTEDDYFKLWYVSEKTNKKFTPDEVRNLTKSMTQKEITDIYGKFQPYVERKDKFYTSMVYRVYLGPVPKQMFENLSRSGLIPFWTDNQNNPLGGEGNYYYNPTAYLKHFVIEYLSPVNDTKRLYFTRESLCAGMPAVVIAKYYEGAKIEGVVESNGEPMKNVMVMVRDDFKQTLKMGFRGQTLERTIEKIPHDVEITNEKGEFSVIAPAGNITLSFYSGNVLLKEITFNGTGEFAPITEGEATRTTSWVRNIGTVEIKKGNVKGIVFWDKDGNGIYNSSIDTPVKAKVRIGDNEVSTSSNGKYEVKDLLPSTYSATAIKEGYDATRENVGIEPGKTVWHNISLIPSKVKVDGTVWYDENGNGKRDENETIIGATVKFSLINALDKNARNSSTSTGINGTYSIQLYPSTYKVSVDYTENIGNETIHYTYEGTIDIKIGDKEKIKDIKVTKD